MTLYQNRFRIESIRLKNWDYSSPGWYFVTLCTHGGECHFGEVVGGIMRRSRAGEIAAEEWVKTPAIRPYVKLDEWIVMPNHLHGIVIIQNNGSIVGPIVETPRRGVSTTTATTKPSPLKPDSLGSIIGQFKSVCTKRIRQAGCANFEWQSRFYDRIVRDDRSLNRIRQYIKDNTLKWEYDRNQPMNC